jgi:WXG100 protein secretion system (Wss), protein YukD
MVKGRRVRLLTIAGGGATEGVVVAADVPVGELQPALAKLVGDRQVAPGGGRWLLYTAEGASLRPAATLHDQDVQDGEVLYFRVSKELDPD